MRITMITEGTYPQTFGGVSVWCDQIVRGLPEHHFAVHALTATGTEPAAWTVPDNVTVVPTALWTTGGRPTKLPRADRGPVRDATRRLITAVVADQPAAFAEALRDLCLPAQRCPGYEVLHEDGDADWLLRQWRQHPTPAGPDVAPSVLDAATSLEVIRHWLRPLLRPAPAGDVSHAVTNGLATLVALAAKWVHGTPFVLTEHGVYLRERYLEYRQAGYPWPVKRVLLGFLRLLCATAYANADLITPGNRFNQRWEVRFGAEPGRIETVYNGVDPADFPPAGREPDELTVVWVGRIDPIKDLETLLRAFALVHAEAPGTRLRVFGGTPAGNEGYRARCAELADQLGVGRAATFEGRIERIRDAYAAGHVVVLSSISEGFPYTVIEAMTSGRATVSTDVGGVREAVADAGLVVPPRDPAAMAQACLRLLGDSLLRHRLGAAARRRALELFTVDRAVDAFAGIYADLAAGDRRTSEATRLRLA